MTMFIQLLVFTCACALGAANEVPPYHDILKDILKAKITIEENVLSMDGNVPLLNDPRRHYAEVIHVVQDEAQHENSCLGHDYFKDYQTNINLSAPFAIANPQKVVDGTNDVITDIITRIDKVVQLINASAQNDTQDSDKVIDEELKNNVEKYGSSREVFLTTGIVATQLNQNHKDYFAQSSQELSAHNFVVTGAQNLEKTVMALKNLYQVMYRPTINC